MDDIYKNIGEYNPNKRRKVFILSDDMIFVMVSKESSSKWIILRGVEN